MVTTNNGIKPGKVTPESDEGIVTGHGNNPQNDSTNSSDFASHGPLNQVPDGKAIAHQIARLTLAGHTVHDGGAGDFLVSKYGLSRYCKDFAELVAFAVKVGAA
jgi:hypothetical protein